MKRSIIIISVILVVSVLIYGIVWLFDDPNKRPVRPIESKPNKILITSNACCSMTYDLDLTLHNKENNEKIVLCTAESVSEFDVLKYKIPKVDIENFEIILSCNVYYGENYLFDKSIVMGNDFDALKNSGLLIYFQEADGMYVNIITANQHDTYKLMYDSEELWELKTEPNQVFAEG
ncbi:MAG: hypothetical protein IKW60_05860 [Clostridia bacterium]|nr:hypothetical protein [Clostridia bacterium]